MRRTKVMDRNYTLNGFVGVNFALPHRAYIGPKAQAGSRDAGILGAFAFGVIDEL